MRLLPIYIALFACIACSKTSNQNNPTDVGTNDSSSTTDVADSSPSEDVPLLDANLDATRDFSADLDEDTMTGDAASTRLIFVDEFDRTVDFREANNSDWNPFNLGATSEMVTANGFLRIVPDARDQNAWFEGNRSPYLFQLVDGDFIVETSATPSDANDPNVAPSVGFNAAGFVIRDPASDFGSENWVMYNVGAQNNAVPFGVEAKTTVNAMSDLELFSVPTTTLTYRLRVCRIGDAFRYFFAAPGAAWQETVPVNDHVREDFPSELQVGVMVGTWTAADMLGTFDYVVAWRPQGNNCSEPGPL